jgi:glycosyltransferase involved in cell wall biosynthesis
MSTKPSRRPVILHVAAVEYTATALLAPQMRWLQTCGYDVRLACAADGPRFRSNLAEFRPVQLAFPRSGDPGAMARACRQLVQILNEIKPSVVHLHTPAAAIPSRLIPRALIPRESRLIYTVHGFAHVWDSGGWRNRALERVERALAPRTDLMLFQSREDLVETQRRGYRTTLRYLGNGVEEGWFMIPPRHVPSHPLELLFVGRLVREKGVRDLLEALSSVPEAKLTVVGTELPTERDGVESAARSRAKANDLSGRVRFLGAVAKDHMPAVVANCDAMVLPSYREGVPRSLIEGFAAGRPAVATDVRGCRELIEDDVTGFLVPPRNPDRLAVALRRLVDLPPDRYRAMSAAAHALASDQYRESAVLERLLNAYAEIGVPPRQSVPLGSTVVLDDLTPGHLGAGAPPEEEHRGGSVDRIGRVNVPVQVAQPKQQGTDCPTRVPRASQASDEVVEAPKQLCARPGRRAGVDLGEPSEEIATSASREALEVGPARVDLLHEGRLGIDEATVGENPMNLPDHLCRGEHVLEDRLYDDRVDATCRERDRMRIGDQLADVTAVEVEPDHLDLVTTRVESVQTVANSATPDDKDPAGSVSQHVQQSRDVALGDPVERLPDASQ